MEVLEQNEDVVGVSTSQGDGLALVSDGES
jgi:hypothetical protein